MRLMPGHLQTFLVFFVHTLLSLLWPGARVDGEPSGAGAGAGGAGPGPGAGGGGGGGGAGAGSKHCPRVCFCNTLSKIVYCSRRGMPYIPSSVPRDTLQLNLNGNVFTSTALQRSNFSRLTSLEHLYMSECGIETIEVDTFRDLGNLEWLDLSNNRIKVVQDHTFRGLQLQHLFLNGNRHIALQPRALDGLHTNGLYLHDCSLTRLHPEVLTPLNHTLRYLWLNGNELDRLERRLSPLFSSLSHLRLGSNPLHCNCELLWLKEFYDRHGDKFKGAAPPSCLTPHKLKGKVFNEMAMTDFRCQAPVFNNIDALFDTTQGRLKCTATGDPAPTLYWIQPNGRTSKYTAPPDEDARKNEGMLTLTKAPGSESDLAGMYICVANNEAGNVTLTINVSWPHSRVVSYKTVSGAGGEVASTLPPHHHRRTDRPISINPDGGGVYVAVTPGQRGNHDNNNNNPTLHTPDSGTRLRKTPPTTEGKAGVPGSGGQGQSPNNNYTALNMFEPHGQPVGGGGRVFNLSELIGAIIGTHVCTLLLCLIIIPIYYRKKWNPSRHNSLEKPPPPAPDSVYLNGLGHHTVNYMDIPSSKR